jgi:hypothetical protein
MRSESVLSLPAQTASSAVLFLDRNGGSSERLVAPHGIDESDLASDAALRCARCGHAITSRKARIVAAGRHEHTCLNPGGFVYRIGCFKRAPGCSVHGEPSPEWSWFEGYLWQVAQCDGCGDHAGWHFGSSGGSFFGLIVDKLIDD